VFEEADAAPSFYILKRGKILLEVELTKISIFHFFHFLAEKIDLMPYPVIGLHFAGYHLGGIKDRGMTAIDALPDLLKGLIRVAAA